MHFYHIISNKFNGAYYSGDKLLLLLSIKGSCEVWQYFNISPDLWELFITSAFKDTFFKDHIENKYSKNVVFRC